MVSEMQQYSTASILSGELILNHLLAEMMGRFNKPERQPQGSLIRTIAPVESLPQLSATEICARRAYRLIPDK